MKTINEVLEKFTHGDWQDNLQQAARLSRIEAVLQRLIIDAGYEEMGCRVQALTNGRLDLLTNACASARLRQMRQSLLRDLQKEFSDIKQLRFRIRV